MLVMKEIARVGTWLIGLVIMSLFLLSEVSLIKQHGAAQLLTKDFQEQAISIVLSNPARWHWLIFLTCGLAVLGGCYLFQESLRWTSTIETHIESPPGKTDSKTETKNANRGPTRELQSCSAHDAGKTRSESKATGSGAGTLESSATPASSVLAFPGSETSSEIQWQGGPSKLTALEGVFENLPMILFLSSCPGWAVVLVIAAYTGAFDVINWVFDHVFESSMWYEGNNAMLLKGAFCGMIFFFLVCVGIAFNGYLKLRHKTLIITRNRIIVKDPGLLALKTSTSEMRIEAVTGIVIENKWFGGAYITFQSAGGPIRFGRLSMERIRQIQALPSFHASQKQ